MCKNLPHLRKARPFPPPRCAESRQRAARAARRRPDRGKGRCGGHSWAVRLRQDHPAALLELLETADAGQLVFDGESFDLAHASRTDIARLRKKTAFVFQNYNLFRNKTALQNVTEGLIVRVSCPRSRRMRSA